MHLVSSIPSPPVFVIVKRNCGTLPVRVGISCSQRVLTSLIDLIYFPPHTEAEAGAGIETGALETSAVSHIDHNPAERAVEIFHLFTSPPFFCTRTYDQMEVWGVKHSQARRHFLCSHVDNTSCGQIGPSVLLGRPFLKG